MADLAMLVSSKTSWVERLTCRQWREIRQYLESEKHPAERQEIREALRWLQETKR